MYTLCVQIIFLIPCSCPLNTACISRGSACHVFSAIHHNRSCHSWLQRASALPTVQACASPWKTVCIAHCASMCKPVHCTLCTLCKQPRNKYLGSIQLPHISSIRGFPFSKTVPDQANFMETYVAAVHPTPAISYVQHPSLPSLRATETHNLHDPHKRPVLLVMLK